VSELTIDPWRSEVFNMIDAARDHQDAKFPPDSPDSHLPKGDDANDAKYRVLGEELGEVARELNDRAHRGPGHDLTDVERAALHHELIQLAACCVAWVEHDLVRADLLTSETS
jgi:hypothetical protein